MIYVDRGSRFQIVEGNGDRCACVAEHPCAAALAWNAFPRRIIAHTGAFVTSPKIHVLLVEDNPGDVYLITHALELGEVPKSIHVVDDGEEALAYLHRRGRFRRVPRPDLIVLDLNLPRVDGRTVLAELKIDPDLMTIPVVILSSSREPSDIADAYEHHANCYLSKPFDLSEYLDLVRAIEDYWLGCVALPV